MSMCHFTYFEGELPCGHPSQRSWNATKVELFVSDFSGLKEIYLQVDGQDKIMWVSQEAAKALVAGLGAAITCVGTEDPAKVRRQQRRHGNSQGS
jgi:hypothetical protein